MNVSRKRGVGDDRGLPDAVGPHGPNPPSRGRVDRGGTAGPAPLDFEDDEIYSGRGKNVRRGGTAAASGSDSGRPGPPSEQLSGSNQPSAPDAPRRKGS